MKRRKNPEDLNTREKAILKYIEKEIEENGYAPSVREIGKKVGLRSTATVHGYVEKSRSQRLLWRKRISRSTCNWKNYSRSSYTCSRKCNRYISNSFRLCRKH